ncbi:MAG: PspA/IM30 family protein [Candidatus Riflebacteria bacterium]|nr:PspA/IM30 family protein [Candidatus Riflebacteria bacterium]
MGVFSRLSRMIKANINALLDAAEDPEKTLNQIIADMKEGQREAKEQVAQAMVDEKKMERRVTETRTEAARWREKAQLALQRGDENLAKQALVRHKASNEMAEAYGKELEKQKAAVAQLRQALELMEKKIESAKAQRAVLLTRKKVAETTRQISQTASDMKIPTSFAEFDRIAEKIEDMEIKAGVMLELSEDKLKSKLDEAEVDRDTLLIDDELSKLKAEMGLLEDKSGEKDKDKDKGGQ